MVAIREVHFNHPNFDLEKWATRNIKDPVNRPLLVEFCLKVDHLLKNISIENLGSDVREMVEILAPLQIDIETLQSAVLSTLYKNKNITLEFIEENFPPELLKMVKSIDLMSQIGQLHPNKNNRGNVENIRRMFIDMVEDVRTVVVKLAERICVLRSVKDSEEETRVLVARETRDIYIPLCNRLGIGQLKWELEDVTFRYLHPNIYSSIANKLDGRRVDREKYIDKFVLSLKELISTENIDARVYGRPKHIFSIWRKMQKKDITFDELYDVRAVRIIAEEIEDCYAILGLVHATWRHIPEEFDDYIANKKSNGYQSIHTVVLGPENKTVEIQIRTQQMQDAAELGVAAHWRYKTGSEFVKSSGYEDKMDWLRKILEWQDDVKSVHLIEEVKSQVFEDRVYVFTPNNDVFDLPLGSTVLDFAYHVHSKVGHRCIGAKVDGRIVPFTYQVKTGQHVEVLTSKQENPRRDWLNPSLGYIKTHRSRAKIAHWFKQQDRDKNIVAGKEILEQELTKVGLLLKDALCAVERFNVASLDDMLAAIGGGDIRLNQVVNYIQSKITVVDNPEEKLIEDLVNKSKAIPKAKGQSPVIANGVGNLLHHMANCCKPVLGDEIIGFITKSKGISIHREDCEQFKELQSRSHDRVVNDVSWAENYVGGSHVTLKLIVLDRSGLLKDVTSVLSTEKTNIMKMNTESDIKNQTATIDIELELSNLGVLTRILSKLKNIEGMLEARRL